MWIVLHQCIERRAKLKGGMVLPSVSIEKDVLSTYVIHPSNQEKECNSSFDRSQLADVLLSIRV